MTVVLRVVLVQDVPDTLPSSKLSIRKSDVGGLGVFLDPEHSTSPGEILTEYGSTPQWVDDKTYKNKDRWSEYVYALGPFPGVRPMSGVGRGVTAWILWDAEQYRRKYESHKVAHLVNTSHPLLEPPTDSGRK